MASDLTRWRQGARDAAARKAHNAETRDRRRETARESLTRDQRATILQHVREGRSIRAAATALGLSVNRVMLLGRTDDVWRAELDRALLDAARRMHEAGWSDQAERLASAVPPLRETWSAPVSDLRGVIDALESIRDGADAALAVLLEVYPDPFTS